MRQLRQRNGHRPKIWFRIAIKPSLLDLRMSVDPHLGHAGRGVRVTPSSPSWAITIEKINTGLVFHYDPGYKDNLKSLIRTLSRRSGYLLIVAIAGVYGWVALRGPQGMHALLEKRQEIRQLQEQNATASRENERRREHILRLEQSQSEQEMEIRKQLKLLRPGETTFILPEAPKPPEP